MIVRVLYTNHRGETSWRRIIPMQRSLRFSRTLHHPDPQWLMDVWDLNKQAERTFAMKDIVKWVSGDVKVEGKEETPDEG